MSDALTPPHRPTYGVRLSQAQLKAIIATVLPGRQLLQSSELPRGRSFNNRIYFLDLDSASGTRSSGTSKYVLRLCGHFFGTRKVHNEVGWLLKLRHHCPSLPIPEVVAWSAEGDTIETADRGVLDLSKQPDTISQHGWVLQTRLPGRILDAADLDGPHGSAILRELAEHLSAWRTKMRSGGEIGNLSLVSQDHNEGFVWKPSIPGFGKSRGFVANGLFLTHKQDPPFALRSWPAYYHFLLQDKYEHMMRASELGALKPLVQSDVERFLKRMPVLPFLKDRVDTKFTHMDFAPRNILISDNLDNHQPPQVTGILDFEFSAFLPAPTEFLNSLVNQPDDWPPHHYRTFLAHLQAIEEGLPSTKASFESIGIPVTEPPESPCPDEDRCQCDYHNFKNLSLLEAVIANVAPWYIMPESHVGKDEELLAECQKAADIVLNGIHRLEKLLPEAAA